MQILELMCSLEEAYDRFGDIDVVIDASSVATIDAKPTPKELIIESEEFIIKCG